MSDESLYANPPAGRLRVEVVDNASGDGTAEMVAREFPDAILTVNPDNAGFGRANNPALARGEAPYALVLNPDTRVTPGALDSLLALLEAHPEVGMIGPRLERDRRQLRPRLEPRVSDPAQRSRPLHRGRAPRRARAARSPRTAPRRTTPARSTRSTAPSC